MIGHVLTYYRYYMFVSETIYSESVFHLLEIIHQSNSSIMNFTNRVMSGMHVWKNYLEDVNDENEVKDFIQSTQEEYAFTDFYLPPRFYILEFCHQFFVHLLIFHLID